MLIYHKQTNDYPDLKKEDIKTALFYASEFLGREEVIPL